MFLRYILATLIYVMVMTAVAALIAWLFREVPVKDFWHISYAAAMSLTAAIISFIPIAFVLPRHQIDSLIKACLTGIVIRPVCSLTIILFVYFLYIDRDDHVCFFIWNTLFYLGILAWETVVIIFLVNDNFNHNSPVEK